MPAHVRALEPFLETLERSQNPLTILGWLRKPGQAPTLRTLLAGEVAISHEALDGLDRGKSTEHLRAALVHAGVLAPRAETLAKLRLWIPERLETVNPGEDPATLRRFATWKIARELAARRQRDPGPAPHAHEDAQAMDHRRDRPDPLAPRHPAGPRGPRPDTA